MATLAANAHRGRVMLLVSLITAGYVGLGVRLVDIQVLQHDKHAAHAMDNTRRRVVQASRRGDILDTRGTVLATSRIAKTVCADPSLVGSHQLIVAQAIAPFLGRDAADLAKRMKYRVYTDKQGRQREDKHVVLKRKVPLEDWKSITNALAHLQFGVDVKSLPRNERLKYYNVKRSVFCERVDSQLRVYPSGNLAAHVTGFVGARDPEGSSVPVIGLEGKHGIEKMLDSALEGVRGWRETETDRSRREVVAFREHNVKPRDGMNVVLTLDANVQYIAEKALEALCAKHTPASACVVVVNPQTGAILALANRPTFDPNKPGESNAANRRNRVITDSFEPGSTFKIVAVSGALNEGAVRLTDRFHCENGRLYFAGKVLRDHHAYGPLSVREIITKSSNIGTAKVAMKLGSHRLHNYISQMGFGQRSGVPLPGEVRGILHPVNKWSKLSISRIPMGHGIAATPLQLVMAMSAMANGGNLMRPLLVDRLVDRDGNIVMQYEPTVVRKVIRDVTAQQMVQTLRTVVSDEGTASQARLENYAVAGKTGTAQKPSKTRRGYEAGKYFSSFIGFLPAENPQLCIGVFVDEPHNGHYGGTVAGPAFKMIAEQSANYLGLEPSVPVKSMSEQKSKVVLR
ncbi:MAG TPA: penicillin-binding protein 2 [Verrucomicrobiota bacterium]|nr:penicillin-binding protein 2 [Verrucomicrobiota bacterium]